MHNMFYSKCCYKVAIRNLQNNLAWDFIVGTLQVLPSIMYPWLIRHCLQRHVLAANMVYPVIKGSRKPFPLFDA